MAALRLFKKIFEIRSNSPHYLPGKRDLVYVLLLLSKKSILSLRCSFLTFGESSYLQFLTEDFYWIFYCKVELRCVTID